MNKIAQPGKNPRRELARQKRHSFRSRRRSTRHFVIMVMNVNNDPSHTSENSTIAARQILEIVFTTEI
jgi:hypothetical protein